MVHQHHKRATCAISPEFSDAGSLRCALCTLLGKEGEEGVRLVWFLGESHNLKAGHFTFFCVWYAHSYANLVFAKYFNAYDERLWFFFSSSNIVFRGGVQWPFMDQILGFITYKFEVLRHFTEYTLVLFLTRMLLLK